MNLENKTILLTGATGGIGIELAKQLDAGGAKLILSARNEARLNEILAGLSGGKHSIVGSDLTDPLDRRNLVTIAKDHDIDLLINLAGINDLSLLEDMSEDAIERMLDMNMNTPIMLCQMLAPFLANKPGSAIVNVGSILGSIGYAGSTIYCASKFGLRGFSEALRREYADTALKVLYVAPRATNTTMNSPEAQAMNKALGSATDAADHVAREIVRAMKHEARVNYLGWPEKFFVRLNAIFPFLVDAALLKQLPIIRNYARKKLNA